MFIYLHNKFMETLKSKIWTRSNLKNFVVGSLLLGALNLWFWSCWKTTQKDISEQRQKIEILSFNIVNCINARKEVVNQYNSMLDYPATESNKYEIDNHLCLLEEQIHEYDEKIKDFVEEKIDAEADLSEKIEDRWTMWVHTHIDPNKWDYLLTVQ